MRIDSATVGMESARMCTRVSYYGEASTISAREGIKNAEGALENSGFFGDHLLRGEDPSSAQLFERENNPFSKILTDPEDVMEEDLTSDDLLQNWQQKMHSSQAVQVSETQPSLSTYRQFRIACLEFLLRMLFREKTGRTEYSGDDSSINGSIAVSGGEGTTYQGYSLMDTVTMVSAYEEQEETAVSMDGVVKTKDGRELSFRMDVTMSRSFEEYYEATYQRQVIPNPDLCDPLVINLDTDVASLQDQTFYFDLDMDGEEDKIARLCEGSGFLTLDKNDDGVINDGSELFGAKTGDGFAELARYDLDGDGFIDEDDPIWEKLKIWTKDADGKDVLYTLRQAGVGAIFTGAVSSEFALHSDTDHAKQGVIRKTGFYLTEQGEMGTVQHVDIALQ